MIIRNLSLFFCDFWDVYDDGDDSDCDPNFNPAEYSDTDDDLLVNDAVHFTVEQSLQHITRWWWCKQWHP